MPSQQEQSFDGRSALVTGASRGIGRATALELASMGADVAVLSRTTSVLESLADEIHDEHDVQAIVASADVSDGTAVDEAVDRAVDALGGLDIVVSNAGVAHERTLPELDSTEYRRVMAANVDGTFYVCKATVPHLRESSGHLVFVGSIAGKYPSPKFPVYAATKWWIRGFAKSLAGDVGADGVATSIVNPTSVRTDIGVEARERSLKEKYEPGEVAEPEDVARAIASTLTTSDTTTVSELDLFRRDEFVGFFS